jgi:hypothetical protein
VNGPLDIHPKVAAGSAAAAAAFLLEYLLAQFGINMPTDVAAALVVVLGFAAGWLAPNPKG